jgi:hypothetical protein
VLNDINIDNRLRFPVRGRVIVATTSRFVEFVDDALRNSYPLYAPGPIPEGKMLVFCVEVDGFLTFDVGSVVRILPETHEFQRLHYDPTAYAVIDTADPFRPQLYGDVPYGIGYESAGPVLELYISNIDGTRTGVFFDFVDQSLAYESAQLQAIFIPGSYVKG